MQLIITDEDSRFEDVIKLLSGWPLKPLVLRKDDPDLPTALEAVEILAAERAPVPPPPPPPPPPPVVAGNPPGSPTKLDATGMPWDHRIHSEVKKLNTDGTWRLRRNLDKDVLAQVKVEYAAAGTVAAGAAAVAGTATGSVVGATPVPPPPAPPDLFGGTPVPPPPPATPAEPAPMTFSEACLKITAALTTKQITKDDVPAALARMGLANLVVLASQPSLIPVLLTELGI